MNEQKAEQKSTEGSDGHIVGQDHIAGWPLHTDIEDDHERISHRAMVMSDIVSANIQDDGIDPEARFILSTYFEWVPYEERGFVFMQFIQNLNSLGIEIDPVVKLAQEGTDG